MGGISNAEPVSFPNYILGGLLVKIKVLILAIFDGIILIAAAIAFVLGFIYAVTISAEYLLLALAIAPALWMHHQIEKLCDFMQGLDGGDK